MLIVKVKCKKNLPYHVMNRLKNMKQNQNHTQFLKKFFSSKKRGFSIMEVMISAFVLSFGLVAVTQLLGGTLKNNIDSRDRIIASSLAQEGVELVRNFRDTNVLNDQDSFDGIVGLNLKISFDSNPLSLSYGGGFENKRLFKRTIGGVEYYSHAGGEETHFFRQVRIISSGDTRTIQSLVVWGGLAFPSNLSNCTILNKCTYSESILTQWQEE